MQEQEWITTARARIILSRATGEPVSFKRVMRLARSGRITIRNFGAGQQRARWYVELTSLQQYIDLGR